MKNAKIENNPVDLLKPYENNSRTHSDENVEQIVASIKRWGWTMPILIDEENTVIAGHARLMAAKKIGLKDVPCLRVNEWSDEQKKAYVIADNQLAMGSDWDYDILASEIQDLIDVDFDVSALGFDESDLDEIFNGDFADVDEVEGLTEDDAVPQIPEDPVSVRGDVWKLGIHRVMCGDSTSLDDVDKMMDGAEADMVFTDPPYGFNYTKKSDGTSIKNDGAEFEQVISDALSCVSVNTAYVCGDAKTAEAFLRATSPLGSPKSCIVWVKPIQHRMHRYEPCHEFIWYWGDNGSPFYGSNVFEAKREIQKFHPTIKPVELIEYCLASHRDKKIVVDFFGGSGSTLIACEKIGRHCRMMELDEKYVDTIICRWQDFTGKEAIHADTGKTYNIMKQKQQGKK